MLTALAVICAVTDLTAHIIPNGAVMGFGAVLLVAAPLGAASRCGAKRWARLAAAVCCC
ncbi:hypothetical protein HMSSN139_57860 [Paenibacillus sp. HMSSN-139]|nr:hypothetical protein HMSSN139_57860 [Paenibacillus sp. HMSSN-139]